MLKINSKKKVNKPANVLKPQFPQKKALVQPEWNSTQSDLDRYKLSKAEQVQKKVSMISKHRYEAKELWLQRQEKLKKGIVDEETQTVMETCLQTKRPPERNLKNLTYFIKDDTYADYLDQAYEESEEKRLVMADLHQQQQIESKPKVEKSRIETTTKQKSNQDVDEGDDFIRKVNESLKDARDFMTKMERYPSLSNPEKALKAAMNSLDKENNSRSSSSHAKSKPEKKKPVAVNTSSTNLKSSLNNSQNGNKRNLSSSSGFKDSISPQLPKTNKKVEEALSQSQPKYEDKYEEKYEEEEAPKEAYNPQPNVEKGGEDISNYFKSLNQIEDTIKFLEENIMGGGSSVPEKKENKFDEDFGWKAPTSLERFGFEDLTIKSPIMNNKIQQYSPHKIEEKDEEEDSYFKQRQPSPKHHSDIKHHDSDHEEDHEKELSHDDEQISFALTMRSNDQTERNYAHDHHHDPENGKLDYASKLFGFDDMISPVGSASIPQKQFPIPIQTPEYPQAIFENKAIQERTRTQPVVKHSPPKAQPQPVEEDEEDEEDFNIERIKGLLQATKLEIDKMNTGQMEAYNNSYKTALEDMDKENVSNNKGFSTLPRYNNFDDTYKSDYPMGKKIEVVRNENFVTVKQPFNAAWENQRRVLADVNGTRNMMDDDIPAPQTLDIKKSTVLAMNYSPKKVDDVPFNFRSFRK